MAARGKTESCAPIAPVPTSVVRAQPVLAKLGVGVGEGVGVGAGEAEGLPPGEGEPEGEGVPEGVAQK